MSFFLFFCFPSLLAMDQTVPSPLFPAFSHTMVTSFLAREPNLIPVKSVKQDFGFNMPKLTDAHRYVLKACKDKTILEFGLGHGYFMAKALVAGAEVTGVEKSQLAADTIPNIIKEYENYFRMSFDHRFQSAAGRCC